MTDKEMAEEYVCNKADKGNFDLEQFGTAYFSESSMKLAYLTGLKTGRPKWHKVADGDYPPCEKGNYTINVLTDCGDIAYYDYNDDCWVAEPSSAEIDPPIAWCEIPKFAEE